VLSRLLFSISAASDSPHPEVLEQFEFSFTFLAEGASMTVQRCGGGGGGSAAELVTPASLKKQACAVLRMLIASMSTLTAVPEDRNLSMALIYNDKVGAAHPHPIPVCTHGAQPGLARRCS
jgi:hypothetical protein